MWERKDLNGFQTMRSEHKVQMNTKHTNDTQRHETVGFTVIPGANLLLLQSSANEKTKCENQLQSKWFWRKDTETFPSECSKMCCLKYISLYCLCIIMVLITTYSQSHRSVLYLTTATAAHCVERITFCSFKIRSCFNAAHASWSMIFIFISLHSNKLYFLDTLSYY